ncbi:MAG: class II fructose-bisphosphate aldolase [Planctomycetaceae bacterium]
MLFDVTINAALKAFSDMKSDGIIQFSTGAGEFASGLTVKDKAYGTIAMPKRPTASPPSTTSLVALHTDHCQPKNVGDFLKPLIEETARRRQAGLGNLFQSHMLDASILPSKRTWRSAKICSNCVPRMKSFSKSRPASSAAREDGRGRLGNGARPRFQALHHPRRHARRL